MFGLGDCVIVFRSAASHAWTVLSLIFRQFMNYCKYTDV